VLIPQKKLEFGKQIEAANLTRDFFSENGVATYLAKMENNFECSSFCEPNLFFINKDLSEGRPRKECIQASADTWGSSKSYKSYGKIGAIFSIVTGTIMMLAALVTFPVCCGAEPVKRSQRYQDEYI
jgi:hypothetical protein